jgi:uncharacterized phiE125 gp8 family phage protein
MIDARRVQITTPPVEEPVTLNEAKEQLHILHDDEDTYIYGLLVAARIHCEQIARRSFVTRTYTAVLDCWPYMTRFELPYPPLVGVTSITYTDDMGVRATFDPANYLVDSYSQPGRIALKANATYPSVTLQEINAVEIAYTAGYGLAFDVPDTYKAAIRLLVGHWYENREAVTVAQGISIMTTPLGVDTLLLADRGGW